MPFPPPIPIKPPIKRNIMIPRNHQLQFCRVCGDPVVGGAVFGFATGKGEIAAVEEDVGGGEGGGVGVL